MPISRDLTKASRPVEATDGSDWNFRMLIADHYKRLVTMRRWCKIAAIVQILYIMIRTGWKFVPTLVKGYPMHNLDVGIFGAGIVLFLINAVGFGFGKPQKEKDIVIIQYSIFSLFLAAELVLLFWQYHVEHGAESKDAYDRETYPIFVNIAMQGLAPKLTPGTVPLARAALIYFERIVDTVGVIIAGFNVWLSKEYVMEKKSQKKAAAKSKAQ